MLVKCGDLRHKIVVWVLRGYKMYLCCSNLSHSFCFVYTQLHVRAYKMSSRKVSVLLQRCSFLCSYIPVALVCAKLNTYLEPLSTVDVSFSPLLYFFRTHIIFFLPFCAQLPWNVVKVVSLIRTPAKKLIKTTKF